MEKLKKLVDEFYDYTRTISVTEDEMISYYCEMINEDTLNEWEKKNVFNEKLEEIIKAEILYDFIYNIKNIKRQMVNDTDIYAEDEEEYKEILNMERKIKEVFTDFSLEVK